MKRIRPFIIGCLTLLFCNTAPATPSTHQHKISPKIWIWLSSPAIQKISRPHPSVSTHAPVSLRFRQTPPAPLISALEQKGVRFTKRPGIELPLHLGPFYSARATAQGLQALSRVDLVQQVDLDTLIQPALPLDLTVPEIQTPYVWARAKEELPLNGGGMIIGSMDTGIDPFHPAFFKADGGLHAWLDTNGNEQFDPQVDAVDLNNNGIADPDETLCFFDAEVIGYLGDPILDSANKLYDPAYDWLYADTNGNKQRDFGLAAGFDDTTPTFGEPLFMIEDLNQNNQLDPQEKVVALGTSKVLATYYQGQERRRGVNLTQSFFDDWASHGTGTSSIMVGGHQGLQRRVGIATQAELLMANTTDPETPLSSQLSWLAQSGAQVVLHEYAPWTGYHLDGSSNHEQLMDQAAQLGIPQINPAGNLGGADKHMRTTIAAPSTKPIPINVPGPTYEGTHYFMQLTLLWRNPEVDLEFTLEDPTGRAHVLPIDNISGDSWDNGQVVYYSYRNDSSRGTAMMDVYIYGLSGSNYVPIPSGNWTLTVNNPSSNTPVLLLGYLTDAISTWGRGIAFTQDISEEGLICWPATADSAITVAASTGHIGHPFDMVGAEPQGALRTYSGRGIRIDGEHIMDITAPDNPIVAQNQIAGHYNHGAYGIFGGTSGAGPHVAGAAILIKQFNSALDGLEVREAIRQGALVDAQVGTAPSDSWGYGKLRIYRSIFGQDPIPNTHPSVSIELPEALYVNVPVELTAKVQDNEDTPDQLLVRWDNGYDGTYDTSFEPTKVWSKTFAEAGLYRLKVEVKDSGGLTAASAALVRVEVAPPPPEGPVADAGPQPSDSGTIPEADSGTTPATDDGCGCRVANPSQSPLFWVLTLLLMLARRRRGR